jgi:hypothetical protein
MKALNSLGPIGGPKGAPSSRQPPPGRPRGVRSIRAAR